jgi:sugar phosphate isomerase/epimerase
MTRRDLLKGLVTTSLISPAKTQSSTGSGKLTRVSLLTFCFRNRLKLPDQPSGADRTIAVRDIPEMFADRFGIHNIEFQHSHFESTEASYLADLRTRIARAGSRMTQINVEFGPVTVSAADPKLREQAVAMTGKWVDYAAVLNCPRVMINQGPLSKANMPVATAALKRMSAYGETKGVKISVETREARPGENAGSTSGVMEWELVKELVEAGNARSNVDIGNLMATDQAALHRAIKALLPSSSGNMHMKVSPRWDLATAVRFTNRDLGYTGLYAIEVEPPMINGVLHTILGAI